MTPSEELTPTTAPLVFVEWEDIQAHEDWNDESEEDSTATLKSVGWLIEDSPRKLVIAATYDYENEKWSNKFAIPKLPPTVIAINVMSEAPFRHVPREETQEERMAPNPNKLDRVWDMHYTIPGQP